MSSIIREPGSRAEGRIGVTPPLQTLPMSPVSKMSTMTSTLMHATATAPALRFEPSTCRPTLVLAAPEATAGHTHGRPARTDAGVYRRRRLVAVAMVFGVVLGVMSFGREAGANRTAEAEAAAAVTVVVQPGDTLWDIARTLAPGSDPRPLADALSDLAGGTSLQPGQRIVVPGGLLD